MALLLSTAISKIPIFVMNYRKTNCGNAIKPLK